jgi:hypothetical protein
MLAAIHEHIAQTPSEKYHHDTVMRGATFRLAQ